MNINILVSAALIAASLLEEIYYSFAGRSAWRAFGLSLFDVLARLLYAAFPLFAITPISAFAQRYALFSIKRVTPFDLLFLLLGIEFFYYWWHRMSHRVRWIWATHCVHHSSNEFRLANGMRFGLTGLFGGWVNLNVWPAPFVWLGYPAKTVFAVASIHLFYQIWVHCEWVPKLGLLEKVFVTPTLHRVHHVRDVEDLDRNYGGMLILFDKIFGTFRDDVSSYEPKYGLWHPQTHFNPLKMELGPWFSLASDVCQAGSLKYVWKPPGWRHDGPGETTEELRARAAAGTLIVPEE